MLPIIIILIMIFIVDRFMYNELTKKWNVDAPESKNKYVNNLHKYGEEYCTG